MTRGSTGRALNSIAVWLLVLVCAGALARQQLAGLTRSLEGMHAGAFRAASARAASEASPDALAASACVD